MGHLGEPLLVGELGSLFNSLFIWNLKQPWFVIKQNNLQMFKVTYPVFLFSDNSVSTVEEGLILLWQLYFIFLLIISIPCPCLSAVLFLSDISPVIQGCTDCITHSILIPCRTGCPLLPSISVSLGLSFQLSELTCAGPSGCFHAILNIPVLHLHSALLHMHSAVAHVNTLAYVAYLYKYMYVCL